MFFVLIAGILVILKPVVPYVLFSLICIIACMVIFYFFLNMKTFEYENSILYISIRQAYFWKLNRRIPPIEFPNEILKDFSIKKGIFTTSLILFINSEGRKTRKIYCEITGLKETQIIELKQSLQNASEYHEI